VDTAPTCCDLMKLDMGLYAVGGTGCCDGVLTTCVFDDHIRYAQRRLRLGGSSDAARSDIHDCVQAHENVHARNCAGTCQSVPGYSPTSHPNSGPEERATTAAEIDCMNDKMKHTNDPQRRSDDEDWRDSKCAQYALTPPGGEYAACL
jgi:hypothetical protein